jgi:hypothetical protein
MYDLCCCPKSVNRRLEDAEALDRAELALPREKAMVRSPNVCRVIIAYRERGHGAIFLMASEPALDSASIIA